MNPDALATDAAPELWKDNIWDRLLDSLGDHSVIPIVGRDLLQVEIDGTTTLLDDHAVCQLFRMHKDRYDICDDIFQIMKEADFRPSQPLRQLAEITDFNLFVT